MSRSILTLLAGALANIEQPALITLDDDIVLDLGEYNANVLAFDPGGASRVVQLWPEAEVTGMVLHVGNFADAYETITVKDDSGVTTIAVIPPGHVALIACPSGVWVSLGIYASTVGVTRFVSNETTGTGSQQPIAHGLGTAPTSVLVVPTELPADLAAGYDAAEGTHTSTNVLVTVTSGCKFKILAFK